MTPASYHRGGGFQQICTSTLQSQTVILPDHNPGYGPIRIYYRITFDPITSHGTEQS